MSNADEAPSSQTDWKIIARDGLRTAADLAEHFDVDEKTVDRVREEFPMFINTYWLSKMKEKGDPFWKQVVPDAAELEDPIGVQDPLDEEGDSPVPNLTHRYPDRVLLLVNHQCPIYCRFCTRKRKVGQPEFFSTALVDQGIEYIRNHPEVRDVVVSGGDPLMLSDRRLEYILRALRSIPHLEIIRIGSKVPCALPQRITPELCATLKKYHPLYVNTHFNHPDEVTPEAKRACGLLADAGIPIGNQAVLLKGVNDDPEVMKRLMQKLLAIRVRPYYIYQADIVTGTEHFRTSVQKGLEVISALRGHTSGLAVPHYVIDAPGGGGKIPVLPETVVGFDGDNILLRNYEGKVYAYPNPAEEPAVEAAK
jgi:lysine 2,3-aminomutase